MGVTSVGSPRHALRKFEFQSSLLIVDGQLFIGVNIFSGWLLDRAGEAQQANRL